MKRIMLVSMTLLCMSCYAEDDVSLNETSEQALIFGSIDYNTLDHFEQDATYKIGARYGRATGLLVGRSGVCSAFLIDDDVVATAHHCRPIELDDGAKSAQFIFGLWSTVNLSNQTIFDESLKWIRMRLVELGVTPSQADILAPKLHLSQRWTCNIIENTTARDVDYWRCEPAVVEYDYFGSASKFGLLPGMLWGHYNVKQRSNLTKSEPLYLLGVNQPSAGTLHRVLLSPGGRIERGRSSCVGPYQNCFTFLGADARCGNSGGPILDEKTNTVFGVFHGFNLVDSSDPRGCSYRSYEDDGSEGYNYGSYLGSKAEILSTEQTYDSKIGAAVSPTPWVGKVRQSPSRWRWKGQCPPDMLAAGIIGHTIHYAANNNLNGRLGNMGLVCLPKTGAMDQHQDRGVVVSPNALPVHPTPTAKMDLNTYSNEMYAYNFDTKLRARQHIAMCPPGYFLQGVHMRYDSASIGKVDLLNCVDPQTQRRGFTSVYDKFGVRNTTSSATPTCEDNSFITGLDVAKVWGIEGVSFSCNRAN